MPSLPHASGAESQCAQPKRKRGPRRGSQGKRSQCVSSFDSDGSPRSMSAVHEVVLEDISSFSFEEPLEVRARLAAQHE